MGGSLAFAPLKDARFVWFFVGRFISTAGSVMAPIALAFAVLEMTSSVTALGQVLAARSIPLVVLLLVGGVVADRFSRSTVLMLSHVASAATQGLVAYLVITGQARLESVIVLEALNGAMTAFTMPAIQGMVPQIVDRAVMQQANALLAFSRSVLAVIGPALAGLLVVTVGAGWALAFDALTWALAAFCMVFVRVSAATDRERSTMWKELRSGWAEFISFTWLWVIVLACGVLNAVHAGAWATLGPMVAKSDPGIGEQGWGMLVSAEAVGLLVCTLIMLRARIVRPLLVGMVGMAALALPLFALAMHPSLVVVMVCCLVAGAGVQVFMITWQTAIHENVPERYLSRVTAYDSLGSFVALPLGQLAVGPAAEIAGPEPTLIGSGVFFLAVVAAALGVPAVRTMRRSTPVGADSPKAPVVEPATIEPQQAEPRTGGTAVASAPGAEPEHWTTNSERRREAP
ncbi:Transmembrane secretion effector [Austwickia chelonae]|uniref:Putative major facilitator superfamily transporter n=1 Tax=Austwickia chelonae NBRC 105200 TaxID=1184607 RepID=K6VQM9_9MICO|nr:MFS transporter [Austwickia chelonae]GAB77675.1 putative major facilitator superfamily transporter [Austwickia chelonae NBRC 105200]SEW15493.1 Transmembrane secretion effector [Austwickia chelonae]